MRGGVLCLLSSCSENVVEEHYVNLDQVACSFYGYDNDPIEIHVDASPARWEVVSYASWLEVTCNEESDILTITAEDNLSEYERSANILVTAGSASSEITVTQLGYMPDMPNYRKLLHLNDLAAVSPSGRFVGGFSHAIAEDEITFLFYPEITDVYTDERIVLGPYSSDEMMLTQTMVMSDSGQLFICDGQNGGYWIFDRDGNYYVFGRDGNDVNVQATSEDGRYWVGYARMDDGLYHPLLWDNGVMHELKMPESNYRDQEFLDGVMARGISADGSIIYGTSWDGWDMGMLYWEDFTGEPKWVGEDVRKVRTEEASWGTEVLVDGVICSAELTKISPTGKWIAGSYRREMLGGDQIVTSQCAAFYNTETEKTTIVEDYGESTGTSVTDDGIAFIGIGSLGISTGVVYDLNTNTGLGSIEEWVQSNYGIKIPQGAINYVNADGSVLFGTFMTPLPGGYQRFQSFYVSVDKDE